MKLLPHTFLLFLAALLFTCISCEDDDMMPDMMDDPDEMDMLECGVDLYAEETFEIEQRTLQFGQNTNVDGTPKDLLMDVYLPVDDQRMDRPVMIWAFGGAFVTGARQNMAEYAEAFARRGFVSATIDYRILNIGASIPDSLTGLDIAIKASGDMKAAVRHFRLDAMGDNSYGIDPDQIYVGGLSAGAIVAIQTAMVSEDEIQEQHIMDILAANGGIEGTSGDADNLSVSSEVAGVVSLSGAIYRLDWLSTNDPPIFSFHGDDDRTVAYDCDFANVAGIDIIPLCGSGPIHERANAVGIPNELITVPGGGHSDIYISTQYAAEFADMQERLTDFMIDQVCM